jgi:hypothetical protein
VAHVVPELSPFDPERILATLGKHAVEFVLVGALAARLHGFPRLTADADLTPRRTPENLDRLAAALRELRARVYTESVPEGLAFDCSGATLGRAQLWNLVTAAGRVDLIFRPSGTEGYDELRKAASRFDLDGQEFLAASLEDILRSKEASDRPQDRQDAMVIREILAADRVSGLEGS